ncbi:MAG: TetR/AcrR family transcriptional regulator [Pseudomonadota bacterium]
MSEIKQRILACARDCFLKEGLSYFSMRKVAGCVGVSATALYRHYDDREALLFHVILEGFRIFSGYLNRVDESQEPGVVLEETTTAYLNFALAEPAYYEVMFMTSEQMTGLKRINKEGAGQVKGTFDLLHQRVRAAMEAGVLDRDDAYMIAYGIWAYAHGQISLYLCGRTGMGQSSFVDTYKRLMRHYLYH